MDQLMTGTNPKADAELAAAIGCKLTDEIPPVILGQGEYTTDASGKAMTAKDLAKIIVSQNRTDADRSEHEATLLSIGFVRGIAAVREQLRKDGVELPIETLLNVMDLTLKSRELSQKPL